MTRPNTDPRTETPMTALTPDHPAVEAVAREIYVHDAPSNDPQTWPPTPTALADDYRGAALAALVAALPHLTGDEPEAPAGPAGPVTPPPVLRIPSQVGSRLYLYPRGHDIDPEAHGMRAVAPAVYGAAVLILTAPDPRTGQPTTVARYLHAYQARQLGRALIAAADYADQEDARP